MADLDVHLDSNLTFWDHISEKINKAYNVLGIIKRSFICMIKFFYYFINQWYVFMSNLLSQLGVHSN